MISTQNPTPKNGALYIRVSTHMQDELSPDAQKRLLLEYAKSNAISVSPEHIFMEKKPAYLIHTPKGRKTCRQPASASPT